MRNVLLVLMVGLLLLFCSCDGNSKREEEIRQAQIDRAKENLDKIDRQLCFDKFNNFLKLHDEEIIKLKQEKQQTNRKFLSCMGI